MTNNKQHTPGSWIAKAGLGRWNVTTSTPPRTFNICSINSDRIEQEANARLIASAPELLKACESLLNMALAGAPKPLYPDDKKVIERAKEAIAKAKGECMKPLYSIDEIKKAVDAGLQVKCDSDLYDVVKSKHTGEYLIISKQNNYCIGLHGREGTPAESKLNGSKFYVKQGVN